MLEIVFPRYEISKRNPLEKSCVLKVVMYRLSSSSSSWWYTCERSSLEKYFAPFNSKLISSTVEIGRRTLFIASLASLVSTQILIPPSFLGTAKIGDTYGVGWSSGTRLIISSLSNSSNLHFTFSRMWYGICCCGCTLGVWSLSMFSFTFSPFNFHRPWNTCLLKILSSLLSLISDTLLMCKLIRPNYHFHLFSWHKMLPRQFISRFR